MTKAPDGRPNPNVFKESMAMKNGSDTASDYGIDVEIEAESWLATLPDTASIVHETVALTLSHMGVDRSADLVILMTDDAEMQSLNEEYRQKSQPTNVLSFPAPRTMKPHIGDIALGFETCAREALEQNKSLEHHMRHLCVHGVLHLLGFDHVFEDDAQEMEAHERTIVALMGIKDPYELDHDKGVKS